MKKRAGNSVFWIAAAGLMMIFSARAQDVTVSAKVDSNSIRIGEQVKLHLEVTHPANIAVAWPPITDSLQGLEIVSHGNPGTALKGPTITDTSSWVITSFDSGMAVVPPLPFTYSVPGDTAKKIVQTQPLPIFVHTVAVDTSKDIKDVKGPLGVPISWADIWPWLAGILVIGGIAWLISYIIRKRMKGESIIPEAPKRPAHEIALDGLRSLDSEHIWQRGMIKDYHSKLTDILRMYIERRYSIMALELPTDETMQALAPVTMPAESRAELKEILVRADFAKFAKFQPEPRENELSMTQAVNFVQSTWRPPVQEQDAQVPATEAQQNG